MKSALKASEVFSKQGIFDSISKAASNMENNYTTINKLAAMYENGGIIICPLMP
jgi:hypothetical protein